MSRHPAAFLSALALLATACVPAGTAPPPGAVPAGVAPGIGLAGGATPAPAPIRGHLLAGLVTLDGPLAGADVRVEGLDGRPIGQGGSHQDRTHTTGVFSMSDLELPADFRMVATGGTTGGKPHGGVLRAEVRGYRKGYGSVPINPVTTLIAARMAARPAESHAQAEAAVMAFLGLPPHLHLGAGLAARTHLFDGATFAAAAAAEGGLDRFMPKLVAEMAAGGTRNFGKARAPRYTVQQEEELVGFATSILMGILRGVLNKAEQEYMDDMLRKVGIEDNSTRIADALAKTSQDLHQLENDVLDDAKKLLKAEEKARYDAFETAGLNPLSEKLDNMHDSLHLLLNLDKSAPDYAVSLADHKASVQADLESNFEDATQQWDVMIRGAGDGVSGGIALYSRKISGGTQRFYTAEMAQRMQRWWDLYDGRQNLAMLYRINALQAGGAGSMVLKGHLARFQATRKAQLQALRGMASATGYTVADDGTGATIPVNLNNLPLNKNGTPKAIIQMARGTNPTPLAWLPARPVSANPADDASITLRGLDLGVDGPPYRAARNDLRFRAGAMTGIEVGKWSVANDAQLNGLLNTAPDGPALATYGFKLDGTAWIGRDNWALPTTGAYYYDLVAGGAYKTASQSTSMGFLPVAQVQPPNY